MAHAWPAEIIEESDEVLLEDDPNARFTVVAIFEGRAWVKDGLGQDAIVPLDACRLAPTYH